MNDEHQQQQQQQQSNRIHFGTIDLRNDLESIDNSSFKSIGESLNRNNHDFIVENEKMGVEYMPSSIAETQAFHNQQIHLEALELKNIAQKIAVPTNDDWVKARLCEIGEPIIFFGENKIDRRNRLKLELAKRKDMQGLPAIALQQQKNSNFPENSVKPLTSEGKNSLYQIRVNILNSSFERSARRLKACNERVNKLKSFNSVDWTNHWNRLDESLYNPLKKFQPISSTIGDNRSLTSVNYSSDGDCLLTASWSSMCRVWSRQGEMLREWKGHSNRVICAKFHPDFKNDFFESNRIKSNDNISANNQVFDNISANNQVFNNISANNNNNNNNNQIIENISTSNDSEINSGTTVHAASSSIDHSIKLWCCNQSNPLCTLASHTDRVNRIDWHPDGTYLGAASHDLTWSLWDVCTQELLLHQEGHSLPVYAISWHPDGSLIATAGEDCICQVWDVRIGKAIQFFKGHVKQIFSLDWHPDGTILCSASEDNSIKLWDMRKPRILYTIPAHNKLISQIKFAPHHGNYLVSASFDETLKVWKSEDWSLISVLYGHDSKVFSLDICPKRSGSKESDYFAEEILPKVEIASAGFDRTWKLWNLI